MFHLLNILDEWGQLYYTNKDQCRIPGHATDASAGFVRYTWASVDTDLNLFYRIHFPIFNSSAGFAGNLAELLPSTVPYTIAHCNQNEAAHQTIKSHSVPCSGVTAFMPQNWWSWQIKGMKSVAMGSFQYRSKGMEGLIVYLWVILLYFNAESRLISGVLELGQVSLISKLIRTRIWQLSDSCQTWVWKFFHAIRHGNSEIWRHNVDFRPNYIFNALNVVNFSMWFLQLTACIFEMLVMWLNRVRR